MSYLNLRKTHALWCAQLQTERIHSSQLIFIHRHSYSYRHIVQHRHIVLDDVSVSIQLQTHVCSYIATDTSEMQLYSYRHMSVAIQQTHRRHIVLDDVSVASLQLYRHSCVCFVINTLQTNRRNEYHRLATERYSFRRCVCSEFVHRDSYDRNSYPVSHTQTYEVIQTQTHHLATDTATIK